MWSPIFLIAEIFCSVPLSNAWNPLSDFKLQFNMDSLPFISFPLSSNSHQKCPPSLSERFSRADGNYGNRFTRILTCFSSVQFYKKKKIVDVVCLDIPVFETERVLSLFFFRIHEPVSFSSVQNESYRVHITISNRIHLSSFTFSFRQNLQQLQKVTLSRHVPIIRPDRENREVLHRRCLG